ncbi:MAG: hypothetical protein DRN19_01235 [Thermoplasmata archaeon]|nr:MAG: hypothetical protein DRN19_01235 [Thermoplasmata archaeon]
MREYRIKRGYNPDMNSLVKEYFGVEGNVEEGLKVFCDGIGEIFIKREGQKLYIETRPSRNKKHAISIIKRLNEFLFRATGKTAKERKKELLKL